jgi:hypothetical protein
VCANLVGCNVEGVIPDCQDGISQCVCDVLGCNVFNAAVPLDGWNRSVVTVSWVGSDPAKDGGTCPDWAQCCIAQCHLSCCVILLVSLLHFKDNVEMAGVFKGWIVVVFMPFFFEEMEISKSEDLGLLFLLLQYSRLHTGAPSIFAW